MDVDRLIASMAPDAAAAPPAAPTPTLPASPGSAADPVIAQLLARAKKGDEMATSAEAELKASQQREAQARAAQQAALQPEREKLKAALQQPAPAAPEFPALPNAPKPISINPQEFQETVSLITALAAISGALTRAPLTAALNAFSQGVKGYVQGKTQLFDESIKSFNEEVVKARTENEATWRKYEAARQKYKDNIQALQNEMSIIAAESQNPIDMQLAAQGRINDLYKLRMSANEKMAKVEGDVARLVEQKKAHDQAHADRMAAQGMTGLYPPETVDYYAQRQMNGDTSWRVGISRQPMGAALILAVDKRIPELSKAAGSTPTADMAAKASRDALSKALTDRTKFVAASNQFVTNFEKQADLVEKYMKPGLAGATPIFNKWIQAGRKQVAGDADVSELDAAIRGLAREHQRIVTGVTSNAQLHASAQETADQLLNVAQTPEQVEGVLRVMRQEARNARQAGVDEVEALKQELAKPIGAKSSAAPARRAADRTFKDAADLEAAVNRGEVKKGDRVTVGGVPGVWD